MINSTNFTAVSTSCDSVLKGMKPTLDLPIFIIKELCDAAAYNFTNHTNRFERYCCQNASNVPVDYNALNSFLNYNCHNVNLTNSSRINFCSYDHISPTKNIQDPEVPLGYILLITILGPIGLLSNMLILLTVLKCKKLQTASSLFICNLAFTDLILIIESVSYLFVSLEYINITSHQKGLYIIITSIDAMLGSASLLYVTAITIERAIAVAKPLSYPLIVTKKRAIGSMVVIWVYCVTVLIIFLIRYWWNNAKYADDVFFFVVVCSFLFPCLLVLISYVKIALIALKNLQTDRKIYKSIFAIAMLGPNTPNRPARFREIKLALNLAIMTTPFVFGWGYYMIYSIVEVINDEITNNEVVMFMMNSLPFIISCVNPVTYLIFTRSLRKESYRVISTTFVKLNDLRRASTMTTTSLLSNSSRQQTSVTE